MCGRFSQEATWQELREYYNLIPSQPAMNLAARYNIGPLQSATIIRETDGGREAVKARFDLRPDLKRFSMFNAKSETVTEKATFKGPWAKGQRAILPVTGFYEWPRPKVTGAPPFHITAAGGGRLQLAALYGRWFNPNTQEDEATFAILTTSPNADMAAVPHHRSPVVIDEAATETWLTGDVAKAAALLTSPPDGAYAMVRVSSYVNKIGNEGPECVEPLA
ncbi:MAG: SOS response-associated peptidase [Pseudomonadota bacterium]